MNKKQIQEIIKDYINDNLKIEIRESYGEIVVQLFLDGQLISSCTERLPTPKVRYDY